MRRHLAARVVAALPDVDRHPRQVRSIDLDLRHLRPAQVLADGDGNEAALAANLAQGASALVLVERDDLIERGKHLLHVGRLLGDDHDAVILPVDGEILAEAVGDAATRRRQQTQVDTVLVGEHPVPVGLDHLQVVHAADERREERQLGARQHGGASGEDLVAEMLAVHLRPT